MTKYCYVLELENDKWYVGKSRDLLQRIQEHFNPSCNSAVWVTKHKPLRVHSIYAGNSERLENILTVELMKAKGVENVRGGYWCCPNHTAIPHFPVDAEEINAIEDCREEFLRSIEDQTQSQRVRNLFDGDYAAFVSELSSLLAQAEQANKRMMAKIRANAADVGKGGMERIIENLDALNKHLNVVIAEESK